MIEINRNPSPRDLKFFAILQIAFFGLVSWSLHRNNFSPVAVGTVAGLSVLVGVIGWLSPTSIRPLFVGWLYAVFPIGWTISHLLVGLTFYGLITPLGFLARLAGHDPLKLRWDQTKESYWEKRPTQRPPSDYFKQY